MIENIDYFKNNELFNNNCTNDNDCINNLKCYNHNAYDQYDEKPIDINICYCDANHASLYNENTNECYGYTINTIQNTIFNSIIGIIAFYVVITSFTILKKIFYSKNFIRYKTFFRTLLFTGLSGFLLLITNIIYIISYFKNSTNDYTYTTDGQQIKKLTVVQDTIYAGSVIFSLISVSFLGVIFFKIYVDSSRNKKLRRRFETTKNILYSLTFILSLVLVICLIVDRISLALALAFPVVVLQTLVFCCSGIWLANYILKNEERLAQKNSSSKRTSKIVSSDTSPKENKKYVLAISTKKLSIRLGLTNTLMVVFVLLNSIIINSEYGIEEFYYPNKEASTLYVLGIIVPFLSIIAKLFIVLWIKTVYENQQYEGTQVTQRSMNSSTKDSQNATGNNKINNYTTTVAPGSVNSTPASVNSTN